jgi:hypothetical protein
MAGDDVVWSRHAYNSGAWESLHGLSKKILSKLVRSYPGIGETELGNGANLLPSYKQYIYLCKFLLISGFFFLIHHHYLIS